MMSRAKLIDALDQAFDAQIKHLFVTYCTRGSVRDSQADEAFQSGLMLAKRQYEKAQDFVKTVSLDEVASKMTANANHEWCE